MRRKVPTGKKIVTRVTRTPTGRRRPPTTEDLTPRTSPTKQRPYRTTLPPRKPILSIAQERQSRAVSKRSVEDFPATRPSYADFDDYKPSNRGWVVLVIAVVGMLAWFLWPRTHFIEATVNDLSWTRSIEIEQLVTNTYEGWSVPAGGRVTGQSQEVRFYRDGAIIGYDTKTHEEFAGYEYGPEQCSTSYEYDSQGNEYQVEECWQDQYAVYETVEESTPIYEQVPVYETRYAYDLDEWVLHRTDQLSGSLKNGEQPAWPEFREGDNFRKRTGSEAESYWASFVDTDEMEYVTQVDYDEWSQLQLGGSVNLALRAGKVVDIELLQRR